MYLLYGDRFATQFARDAGVFESFKAAVKPLVEATVIPTWGEKELAALRAGGSDRYWLIAAVEKTGKVHYRDSDVRVISDGKNWCLLDEYVGKMTG